MTAPVATSTTRTTSESSLWVLFFGQLRRDLKLAFGQPSELANPLAFFVVVITLFPLGVSPEPGVLASMAPGVLWIAALLATLLGLEALFRRDRDDGTLEQMVLRAQPLYLPVVARMLAHWMVTGLPLTLLAPLLGGMLNLAPESRLPLMLGLALGTPVLVLLGGVGAALTVGLRTGGVLLALLVLPLFVPVLILGVSAAELAGSGLDPAGPLLWLAAGASFAITTVPFAIAAALRIGVEVG